MPPTVINAKPGQVWRARMIVDGAAAFVGAERIANSLRAVGFAHTWVYGDEDALPADWPEEKREDLSGLFERQWWVQVQMGAKLGDQPLGTEAVPVPTDGDNWHLHDWWLYKENASIPIDPDKPPPPDSADIGDYAGRPPAGTQMDVWARGVLQEAFRVAFGENRQVSETALQAVQAVGRGEGYYGWAGKPPQWAGHHNWGAIMCGSPRKDAEPGKECGCGFGAFDGAYVDGKWSPFKACFAHRDTNLDGAIHLVETLVIKRKPVQETMNVGDLVAFARSMRDTSYFCRTMGRSKGQKSCAAATDEEKQKDARWYAKIMEKNVARIAAATGTPVLNFYDFAPQPTHPDPMQPPRARATALGIVTVGATLMTGIALGAATALANRKA